jgi:two-component system sensor histidine kinase AlgZ
MTSIRHFPATYPLPDWRNFGVMLRVLLGVNVLALIGALVQASSVDQWLARFVEIAALVEPLLLATLGVLAALRDLMRRFHFRVGQLVVVEIATLLAVGQQIYWQSLGFPESAGWLRVALLTAVVTGLMLFYFELRARAFTPAQSEARLAALNARIRPHFLFNSLNAVLSLIRARPQQAEAALESLSDLFRAAMRDPGELVSLADEIALGQQYLALEKLRLGERLAVDWQIEGDFSQIPIPPLMLQPLLENAVYHGIEPAPEGGTVGVRIERRGDALTLSVTNPTTSLAQHAAGNQMALTNIRERLALYYDLEARLDTVIGAASYEVRITLPC